MEEASGEEHTTATEARVLLRSGIADSPCVPELPHYYLLSAANLGYSS